MASGSPAELRKAETFPTLEPTRIARIRSAGRERTFRAGEILFEQSTKRVASAVGEGSICIQLVHKVLGE